MGVFDRWDLETLVCGVKGHVTPASEVAALGPEDAGLGLDVDPTWRLSRCLRCDAWIATLPPEHPRRKRLPPLADLPVPRRGRQLRDAVILRLIAIERGVHSVIFAVIAVLGFVVWIDLASIQSGVRRFLDALTRSEAATGRATNRSILFREGNKVLHLRHGTLEVLIITAAIYALVEGTEAVGLWMEKRWAEYLTALATAGFLPFEIYELTKRITLLRIAALIVNVLVLVYLVWAKHLFGIGRLSDRGAETVDPNVLFSRPGKPELGVPTGGGANRGDTVTAPSQAT
jgi:uncharacterized membrane protein (DUF2068 family)